MRLPLALCLCVVAGPLPAAEPVSFVNDVLPVLSRAGCNLGACHGNLNGRGGMRLSFKGEGAATDYATLTRDALGRRVDVARPEESLILKKATGRVPHEGGVRFAAGSPEYAAVRAWVAAGAAFDGGSAPTPVALDVGPRTRVLIAPADRTTIRAAAKFSDGTTRDLADLVTLETTTVGVAHALPSGEVVREADGETVVLARYRHLMATVRVAFVPDRPRPDLSAWQSGAAIDRLAAAKWAELRLTPSAPAADAAFLRRAFLDACGVTPTAAEARAFLADADPGKRAKLIDALLDRPEFAQHWALVWSDLLRNEEKALDRKGVQVFHRWLKACVAADRPLTEFARDILAARGGTYANPATNFYRAVREPYQRAESVAQVFLGLRVGCAKCHNHPFDVWTQDDYHRFAATFARVGYRVPVNAKRDALDAHEFVGDQTVTDVPAATLAHPRGGAAVPKLLGGPAPAGDPLAALADWVADPANPFFARAQANRVWLHLTGTGLVEPNDDFRASNPPSNPALLRHLTESFAANGYRLKPLVREILNSRTYQLSSDPAPGPGPADPAALTHYAQATARPLAAEELLDAVSAALNSPVKFPGYPLGLRAGEVPAPPQAGRRNRGAATGKEAMGARFLKVFGKPDRLLTCECERGDDPTVLQSFQLVTGRLVNDLLTAPDNRLADPALTLDDFFLAALTRPPTDAERERLGSHLDRAKDRRAAWEDIAWAVLNSKEFLLRR